MRRPPTSAALFACALIVAAMVPVSAAAQTAADGEVHAEAVCGPTAGGPALELPSGGFHTMEPTRALDTRATLGVVGGGCTVSVDLFSILPAQATGVALDVVATQAQAPGFVTAHPCEVERPLASNVNPRVGDDTPNAVHTPLGPSRRVCLYSSTTTHLVVDVMGWFGPGGVGFHDATPTRILDTRTGPRPDGGSGQVPAGSPIVVPVAAHDPVPSGATGVALNVTVTNPATSGYLTVYPCGNIPVASNVNYLAGDTRANQVTVGLGIFGHVCAVGSANLDLVIDVAGWYGGPGTGDRFVPITGTRVLDSRPGPEQVGGWAGAIPGGTVRSFDATRAGALPVGNVAVLDVVATQSEGNGYLTVFPCGTEPPLASSVNLRPGIDATNLVIAPLGAGGEVCVFSLQTTHVVIDVLGSLGAAGGLLDLAIESQGGAATLIPPFAPDGHDYGVVCDAGANTWTVRTTAVPGATVAIPGADGDGNVVTAVDDAVVLTVTPTTGAPQQYWVRCLPPDFPTLDVARADDTPAGWYLLGTGVGTQPSEPGYVVLLDEFGAPLWYTKPASPVIDVKRLPNGDLAWAPLLGGAFGTTPGGAYSEWSVDDNAEVRTWSTVGTPTDHHDIQMLENGNMLMITYPLRVGADLTGLPPQPNGQPWPTQVVDSHIQEIEPGGSVVWEWHSEDHIAPSESVAVDVPGGIVFPAYGGVVDLVHMNSIELAPNGNVVFSARHLDAVFEIQRGGPDDGALLWKLGGNEPLDPSTRHLAIVGDPLGPDGPKRQHDARVLPNGHVTMFDNQAFPGGVSRAVEYAVDATAGTATFIWQHAQPDGAAAFGLGGVRRQLDDAAAGTTVIAWAVLAPMFTHLGVYDNPMLEVRQQPTSYSYRVVREPAATFDRQHLRDLMDARG